MQAAQPNIPVHRTRRGRCAPPQITCHRRRPRDLSPTRASLQWPGDGAGSGGVGDVFAGTTNLRAKAWTDSQHRPAQILRDHGEGHPHDPTCSSLMRRSRPVRSDSGRQNSQSRTPGLTRAGEVNGGRSVTQGTRRSDPPCITPRSEPVAHESPVSRVRSCGRARSNPRSMGQKTSW